MTAPVTVYTRRIGPVCVQCDATRRRLTLKGIEFVEVDVDADPCTRPVIAYLGFTGLPVVLAATASGEQSWAGYRPDRIDALAVVA